MPKIWLRYAKDMPKICTKYSFVNKKYPDYHHKGVPCDLERPKNLEKTLKMVEKTTTKKSFCEQN